MDGCDRYAESFGEVLGANESLIQEALGAAFELIGASDADDFFGVERLLLPIAVAQRVECIGGLLVRMRLQ